MDTVSIGTDEEAMQNYELAKKDSALIALSIDLQNKESFTAALKKSGFTEFRKKRGGVVSDWARDVLAWSKTNEGQAHFRSKYKGLSETQIQQKLLELIDPNKGNRLMSITRATE